MGPRRARAVRRRPADRVRRAQERDRHDGPGRRSRGRASSFPGCATSSGRQTPVTVSVGGMTPVRDLRRAGRGAAGARAARLLRRALLHRRRRSWRSSVFSTLRDRGCADTAVDRRARLPDVDRPQRAIAGVPLTASGQEAAQEHYFKLCFRALARLGLPAPGLWILDDFAPGRHSASDVHRPGGGVSFRSLSRGRLREAGGGRGAPTVRRAARDGVQRRLRSRCGRGGRNVRARDLGLDGRAAARSRHDAGAIRRRVRSGRRAAREEAGRSSSPRSRLRCRVGARSSRRGFAAPTRRFASRSSGSTRRAVRWGRGGRRCGQGLAGAEPRSSPGRRREPRSRGSSSARTQLKGSVWIDDVSFGWR